MWLGSYLPYFAYFSFRRTFLHAHLRGCCFMFPLELYVSYFISFSFSNLIYIFILNIICFLLQVDISFLDKNYDLR